MPERGWILTRLLGLGFLGCDWRPGSFPRQSLCLETLPVCMERLLSGLVLSHCLFGIDLAECLTRFAFRFSHWLESFKRARCLCHFFTLSPDLDQAADGFNHQRWPRMLPGPSPLPDIRRH